VEQRARLVDGREHRVRGHRRHQAREQALGLEVLAIEDLERPQRCAAAPEDWPGDRGARGDARRYSPTIAAGGRAAARRRDPARRCARA
jgi:hypothetical protein